VVKLGREYPYAPPSTKLLDPKGLNSTELTNLLKSIQNKAESLAESGTVMVCEFVQIVEEFLITHNKDPAVAKLSAWEQMKAREEKEKIIKNEEKQKLESFMMISDDNGIHSSQGRSDFDDSQNTQQAYEHVQNVKLENEKVQKEIVRKIQALDLAVEGRKKRRNIEKGLEYQDGKESSDEEDDLSNDDDADDFDFDETTDPNNGTFSRYRSDFIELGLLGRGGGGEVVKVRNRLDRRIYAIKKVNLQSEQGKFAGIGKMQNAKLRREVTTISRMTHKNIVRYYQAWIENGGVLEIGSTTKKDTNSNSISIESDIGLEGVVNGNVTESSSDGFNWDKSPCLNPQNPIGSGSHIDSSSSFSLTEENSTETGESFSNDCQTTTSYEYEAKFGLQYPLHGNDFYKRLMEFQDASQEKSRNISLFEIDSSQQLKQESSNKLMYIQMEFCATTLRHLINEGSLQGMGENEVWRLIRQIIEALVYIHRQTIIHRDLKPGNIFLTSTSGESNIRLGDFGLATTTQRKIKAVESSTENEVEKPCVSINDSRNIEPQNPVGTIGSITGGVGTAFYCAPEQEFGENSYDMKVDIFSLGVIIFEMFHPPFSTQMERAENLERLRGDRDAKGRIPMKNSCTTSDTSENSAKKNWDNNEVGGDWHRKASLRFPPDFQKSSPENCQKLILWCLEYSPENRPSAEELLATELIPRKIELEKNYLEDALQSLTNPESESNMKILEALFERAVPHHVEVSFDTDIAAKAHILSFPATGLTNHTPLESLVKGLRNLGAFNHGDILPLRSSTMSSIAISAASASLKRAKNAGNFGRAMKETDARATHRTAAVLAMSAATVAAVTGHNDGVWGADPRIVKSVCDQLIKIFEVHGAVQLKPPLLRPRDELHRAMGGPAELMNKQGVVLLLPEDLTVNFARSIGRGGGALSRIKRYDIGE